VELAALLKASFYTLQGIAHCSVVSSIKYRQRVRRVDSFSPPGRRLAAGITISTGSALQSNKIPQGSSPKI